MIRRITKSRRAADSITWRAFRQRYEAAALNALPKFHARLWQITADDLQRLCGVEYLADVPGALVAFVAALRAEQVDAESIAIYLGRVEHALDWAIENGLIGEPLGVATA